ncbi:MAG: glycine/sarcosine/betaine reductase selenoprotein B family protein [Pyrinomonadaceae bacterium]
MASFDELKTRHRLFTERYPFGRYRVRDNPVARLRVPLAKARIALVTTAGLMLPNDRRFRKLPGIGDSDFRLIPKDADLPTLVEDHTSSAFDHSGIDADRNLALPLERFHELAANGTIGEVAPRAISFMGSIVSPRRLIKNTAPDAARILLEDRVDAVFLTPV